MPDWSNPADLFNNTSEDFNTYNYMSGFLLKLTRNFIFHLIIVKNVIFQILKNV